MHCLVATRLDETVRRRLRAGRMLLAGKTPAEAANAVGVAQQTAYTWKAVLDEGGISRNTRSSTRKGAARVAISFSAPRAASVAWITSVSRKTNSSQ